MNTTHKYMSDARVRHAINIAFDKAGYTEALYGKGNAVDGHRPVSADLAGFQQRT